MHKAKKVSEFVKEKAYGRLSIFFLPPYSPDLNPDEWVWNNVKNDRIGRSVIMSADDLKGLFEVNRYGVSGRLPGVFSWRLRCVMGVLCRGCRQCGAPALIGRVTESVCQAGLEFGEPVQALGGRFVIPVRTAQTIWSSHREIVRAR